RPSCVRPTDSPPCTPCESARLARSAPVDTESIVLRTTLDSGSLSRPGARFPAELGGGRGPDHPRRRGALMLPLAACGGSDAPASEVAAESEATMPPAEGPVADASSEFGVTECDDYITKYMACVGQMPAAAQDAARQALDQT